MKQQNTVISVDQVSKNFKLPHEGVSSVKNLFIRPFQRKNLKHVEAQRALENVSFDVKDGEFFGIVGRNGSGKSTLLKLIAGIYQPTKGAIKVNGRIVPFIELGVGFNPELTGRENVYLNGALMGYSSLDVDVRYDAIVAFAELDNFMDQKLKNYSSGMQVRLAFSVATILADSDILLIDEVLAVGDAAFQRKCFNYFRTLKKNKKTVVFVSHDMEAVREYCDRCVMIDKSQVVYIGSPEVAAEKYIKLFNEDEEVREQKQEKNDNRWGNEAAKVTSVQLSKSDQSIDLTINVTFQVDMDEPIVGFGIKNASGVLVCGTNSKIVKKKLGLRKKGSELSIKWNIPNIFSDDEYTVETAVTERNGVTQADWWHNAATFSVRNDESTPHIVSPKISLEIS